MVREEQGIQKSRSFNIKRMFESPGRQTHSLVSDGRESPEEKLVHFRSQGARLAPLDMPQIGSVFSRSADKGPVSRLNKDGYVAGSLPGRDRHSSDMELMKERFAKLLLGEDMSGGGKGVSSALALSNAITNLAASAFGEQRKLEPMSPDRKVRWKKEIDWLLSVTDHIVEFVPSQQKSKDGTNMEIMVTQQRRDLLMNIPALRKLDAMLICVGVFGFRDFYSAKNVLDRGEFLAVLSWG